MTIVSALAWNITASAADLQWSPDGVTPGGGGTGNWNTTGTNVVWFNGATFQAWNNVPADPHNAFFGGTAGTVTITNNITAQDLNFSVDGYTVTRTGGTFTLGGTDPTINVVAGTAILDVIIAGSAGVTYAGPGTTILTRNSTYTGGTTISGGTLQLGNNTTAGSVVGDIANEGALVFNRSNAQTYSGVISGSGMLLKEGANTLTLTGANTLTGLTTISAGTLQIGSGANGSFTGDILNNSALTFNRTGATPLVYGGTIDGTGTVTKTGNGTVTFTGENDYSGGTT
ncbi:MAG: autotransporter-associated beta strand repeat-containing protein, partial [Methyloceanibacter sp.]